MLIIFVFKLIVLNMDYYQLDRLEYWGLQLKYCILICLIIISVIVFDKIPGHKSVSQSKSSKKQ